MLQRSHDTTIDLDLDARARAVAENPVYYVQYAHARIASILRKAGEEPRGRGPGATWRRPAEDLEPPSVRWSSGCWIFPSEIAEAAERRAPHRMATYALDLAQDFTAFYRDCRVVGAAEEGGDEDFRLRARRVVTQRVDRPGA